MAAREHGRAALAFRHVPFTSLSTSGRWGLGGDAAGDAMGRPQVEGRYKCPHSGSGRSEARVGGDRHEFANCAREM